MTALVAGLASGALLGGLVALVRGLTVQHDDLTDLALGVGALGVVVGAWTLTLLVVAP